MVLEFFEELKSKKLKVIDNDVFKNCENVPSAIAGFSIDGMIQEVERIKAGDCPESVVVDDDNCIRYDVLSAVEMESSKIVSQKDYLLQSGYIDANIISGPIGIQAVERSGEMQYFVLNKWNEISVLDDKFKFVNNFGIYGYPTSSDGMHYATCFHVSLENDLVVIGSYDKRIIRAYKLSDESLVWQFGEYGVAGDAGDGLLNGIKSIDFLANGNVVVACMYGHDDGGYNDGTIFELNSKDGTLVKIHLSRESDGQAVNNEVFKPRDLQVVGDSVFVLNSYDKVAEYKFDGDEMSFVQEYSKPAEIDIGNLVISAFKVTTNEILIFSSSYKKIISVDRDTHAYKYSMGEFSYENSSLFEHKLNGLNYVYSFVQVEDGNIVVADYGNNQVSKIFKDKKREIQYKIADDKDIVYSSLDIDEDGKMYIDIDKPSVDLHIVYKN